MRPEQACCHCALPSSATDKVDHREMSALRTHQSKHKSLPPPLLHKSAIGEIRGRSVVSERDGQARRQI